MTSKQLFGLRMKVLRENRGWTQEYLAEKMEISSNYLSSIERGKENPTFDMLITLSEGLGIEMWEMFDFGHEVGKKELKALLKKFANETDDEKLRLSVKVLRAILR